MKFKFIEKKKLWFGISGSIILAGFIMFLVFGFNYGIDFTGGTMMQIKIGEGKTPIEIKKSIEKFDLNPIITFEGKEMDEVVIQTTKSLENEKRKEIFNKIKTDFKLQDKDFLMSEQFGATMGKEMQINALKAILIASFGMLIYIAVRFEILFAISAVLALLHDVLILLSIYAIFRIPVTSAFVAAVLTVVGYSINDTIVIFDRIRSEGGNKFQTNVTKIANKSLNQTLVRSINTSVTTLLVLISLLIFGVTSIKLLALPLMAGIIAGTYSSIFIASPIWVTFKDLKEKIRKSNKAKDNKKKQTKKEINIDKNNLSKEKTQNFNENCLNTEKEELNKGTKKKKNKRKNKRKNKKNKKS
ncbi:MAG: protein translocase subunit SecF [Clostridiales bacterium]|nr:MAG: protein translocase subunit SecF [Clostridiales bacterium]